MQHFAVLIKLLRDRKDFLEEIRQETGIEKKITSLLVSSSVFFAIYGAIIGASSSGLQVISSAIKLPALYLITLMICLPTLYFFGILFGSTLNFGQYTTIALISVAVISVLLFSFAPITLFFLISIHDYNFFLLLNVAIFAFTGLIGVKFLYQAMQSMERAEIPVRESVPLESASTYSNEFLPLEEAIAPRDKISKNPSSNLATRKKLLQFWLVLYGLVGSQLGWTLRPFFGAPGEPFQLFRNIEGNFYAQVLRSFLSLLGF